MTHIHNIHTHKQIDTLHYHNQHTMGDALNLEPAFKLAEPIEVSAYVNKQLLAEHKLSVLHQIPQPSQVTIGIDEVGRGPLYGSVVVAGVVLPAKWSDEIEQQPLMDTPLSILTDSKQLSEKKRELLFPLIKQYALAYAVVDVPAAVIDELNIYQATMQAMRLVSETLLAAIHEQIQAQTNPDVSLQYQLLIDGNKLPQFDWQALATHGIDKTQVDAQAWVKGDARHSSIAAASVLAKVSRDRQLIADDVLYPQYQLAKHKGYPTKAHIEAIANYGVLPKHRRSFKPVSQFLSNDLP